MISQSYRKSDNLTGGQQSIQRFLPKPIALLVSSYLCLIRPIEIAITQSNPIDGKTFLWFSQGERWSDDQGRTAFAKTLGSFALPLSTRSHRQVWDGFMKKHLKFADNFTSSMIDEMAAHGPNGAKHYGRSHADYIDNTEEREFKFYQISRSWESVLNS